jgi:glutathione S-transferase
MLRPPSNREVVRIILLLQFLLTVNTASHAWSVEKPGGSMTVRFVTHRYCPFAHKVWLALECAEIPYTMEEIDLYGPNGKPDWFWKLNPQGTVPVLVLSNYMDAIVYSDSDDILDALGRDEILRSVAANPLWQDDSQSQSIPEWRSLVNQQLLPAGKRAVLQRDDQKLRQVLDQMEFKRKAEYEGVVGNGNDDRGIFLGPSGGSAPGIADCHAFPFLWRLEEEFHLLTSTERYPHLRRWMKTCQEHPAIRRTLDSSTWWWWW